MLAAIRDRGSDLPAGRAVAGSVLDALVERPPGTVYVPKIEGRAGLNQPATAGAAHHAGLDERPKPFPPLLVEVAVATLRGRGLGLHDPRHRDPRTRRRSSALRSLEASAVALRFAARLSRSSSRRPW